MIFSNKICLCLHVVCSDFIFLKMLNMIMVLAYHELFPLSIELVYKSNSRCECWLHSYIRISLILYQCTDETKQIQTKPYNTDLIGSKYWSIPLTLALIDSLDGVVLVLKELVYDRPMVSDETVGLFSDLTAVPDLAFWVIPKSNPYAAHCRRITMWLFGHELLSPEQ